MLNARFVEKLLQFFYPSDLAVQNDIELQSWIKEIFTEGFLGQESKGFPQSFKTTAEVVKFVTMVIFTCSAQHAAVNFSQLDYNIWMPNCPATMGKPPPKVKGALQLEDILSYLPDVNATCSVLITLSLLSSPSKDFIPLGGYHEGIFSEETAQKLILEFQAELAHIVSEIKQRTTKLELPYDYLRPDLIENNGYYIYHEADNVVNSQMARLLSPPLMAPSGQACIQFWYYMYGLDANNLLSVLIKRDQEAEELVWDRKGLQSHSWLKAEVSVSMQNTQQFVIIFQATRGTSSSCDTALDNITISNGPCSSCLVSCDFDKWDDLCGWQNPGGSLEPWVQWIGNTETEGTGPDDDFSKPGIGMYMLLDSLYVAPGVKGELRSPLVLSDGCLEFSFYYYMYGTAKTMQLNVYATTSAVPPTTARPPPQSSTILPTASAFSSTKTPSTGSTAISLSTTSEKPSTVFATTKPSTYSIPTQSSAAATETDITLMTSSVASTSKTTFGSTTTKGAILSTTEKTTVPSTATVKPTIDSTSTMKPTTVLTASVKPSPTTLIPATYSTIVTLVTSVKPSIPPTDTSTASTVVTAKPSTHSTTIKGTSPMGTTQPTTFLSTSSAAPINPSTYTMTSGISSASSANTEKPSTDTLTTTNKNTSSTTIGATTSAKLTTLLTERPMTSTSNPTFAPTMTTKPPGDPHYATFDRRYYSFMGNCSYILSKPCNDSQGQNFTVYADNEHRYGQMSVTFLRAVHIKTQGVVVTILKGGTAQNFFADCLFDVCELGGAHPPLCEALESYTSECQERNVTVGAWRNDTFCRSAPCYVSGDPHYMSFDQRMLSFMGTCTYTLARSCKNNTGPWFSIEGKNEERGMMGVSYLRKLYITVNGITITLMKGRRTLVNDVRVQLPYSPSRALSIAQAGQYVIVRAIFGLSVRWDGSHFAEIIVPSSYYDQMCGLCGNYNGDPKDDFMKPNGEMANSSDEFANSWQTQEDEDKICKPDNEVDPPCDEQLYNMVADPDHCGKILDAKGPFRDCLAVVKPDPYFQNCIYDMCRYEGLQQTLCDQLQAYTDACLTAGAAVHNWRGPTFCRCIEGCECDPGFILSDSQCVHLSQCGCMDENGSYHSANESWYLPGCMKRCTCLGQNFVRCESTSCNAMEKCELLDGVYGCYTSDRQTCSASGDPHYTTYDRATHHFQGSCSYILSQPCQVSSFIPYFSVETENERRGNNQHVSYVRAVRVNVYGQQVILGKGRKVMVRNNKLNVPETSFKNPQPFRGHFLDSIVISLLQVNGVQVSPPVHFGDWLTVRLSGTFVVVTTDFGLWVRFDGNHHADVSVPSFYSGHLCGLCGNYNGNPGDDNLKPDGLPAGNTNELGESWQVYDNRTECSHDGGISPCDQELENEAKKPTSCGMISDPKGVFQMCHAAVPPDAYFENCVYDVCGTGGDAVALCLALQSYADLCAQAGIPITWRNNTFCPLKCPPGSDYSPCGAACPPSCTELDAPNSCDLPCVEGCVWGAVCHVAGDPHYYTFDHIMHTFMGTCTYTLVDVCNSSMVTPFTIVAKNEERGQPMVSYVRSVSVKIHGSTVTLNKGRRILVCGMCGNYNGYTGDELLMPNGQLAKDEVQLGNSWKSEGDSDPGCQSDDREDLNAQCGAQDKDYYSKLCSDVLVKDKNFLPCHSIIKPEAFVENCIFDMCEYQGMMATLCDNVEAYAQACQGLGITVKWRNSTFCPLPCPPNSHYLECSAPCPPTCANLYAEASCGRPQGNCVEGCQCNAGFVLSDGLCVPLKSCGCVDNQGEYHNVDDYWLTRHCEEECRCQKGGLLECSSFKCNDHSYCALNSDGNRYCKPDKFDKCIISGDPHYRTFDNFVHHYQGKNTYVLVKTFNLPSSFVPFTISGQNKQSRSNRRVSFLYEVHIDVYGYSIRLLQDRKLLVNGENVQVPLRPTGGLHLFQQSRAIILDTDFGLKIRFDGREYAEVVLPITYSSRVRGLCGNYDGRKNNDYMMPDGSITRNLNIFGDSWEVHNGQSAGNKQWPAQLHHVRREVEEEPESGFETQGCTKDQLQVINGTYNCGALSNPMGAFNVCHAFLSPQDFQENCIFDLCAESNNAVLRCLSFEAYAQACQEGGVKLGNWRQELDCALSCPPNSVYSSCMSVCPATCANLAAPSECETTVCMEGCECKKNFVLSGQNCVPFNQCGCTFQERYYLLNEKFVSEDCTQSCTCMDTGADCKLISCAAHEVCTVYNYTRGCFRGVYQLSDFLPG
ncbi:FCGBP protein, partial [Polypterus senegalus]